MFKKIKERFSKRKRLAKKQPEILRYEELEQRVLFSADVVPGLDTAAVEEQVIVQDVTSEVQAEREAAPETLEQPSEEEHSELVLVNENVTDYEQLIADLQGGDNNRIIEVVVLESDCDGIEQVSDILSERSDLAAVHVISHGDQGRISLGNDWLTNTTLQQNRDAIAGWGSALSETGDILFYGCNVAADSDGQKLLDDMSKLTGADVAASDDLTGNVAQGGDWELEYRTNTIESELAVSAQLQQSWAHVLAVAVDDSSSGSTADQASVTVSHTTSGTNRLMTVGVSMEPGGESVTSVTYNGVNLAHVGTEEHSGGKARVEIWELVAPDTGNHDVVVNLSGTGHNGVTVGVMTFTGVNQASPTLAFSSDSGESTTASTTVASAADDLVFGVVAVESGTAVTPGLDQTEYWDIAENMINGGGTIETGAASVTTSWTNADREWSAAAVSIQADTNSVKTAALSSIQDAYIQLKNPTTNAGTSGSMVIDRESTDLQRALVQFDLSSIPAGSIIQSATLKLEATAVGGELTIEAYQLLQSWSEGSTTWNESMSGTNWSTAGGSFNATALDSLTTSATGQHSFDISSLVQGWVDGAQQNHGVLVASPDGGGDRTVTYDSREGTVAPVLEIIYTNPANSAPVLDNTGIMSLSNVLQNSTDPNGDLVSAIITSAGGDRITDVDSGAVEGIAVTAVDTSNGTWEYSINGGSTWTSFGAVTNSSAVVLTDTANDRIRFVPNSDYTGNATITFRAWDTTDGNISGTTAVDTGTGGGTTAFSGVTETADIYVEPVEVLLWLSTTEDVGPDYSKPSSGVAGLPSWSEGEVFGMGNPNLFFGAGTTNGSFSSVFDFDAFAVDSDVDVTGMHYVTSDTSVTGAGIATGSIDLLAGDVIFITETAETLSNGATGAPAGWANNIATTGGDIYVFRAENTDDYSSGYFRLVMNDPATNQTQAVTLVESAITIGDTIVDAGDFIYAQTGDADKNDIYWYDTSTDTSFLLIEGDDIAIDSGVSGDAIRGIELIEQSITLGGIPLNSGNILLTIDKADTTVGGNNLSVQSQDVFLLNVTATTLGSGTAAATATLLFDGDGNVNFDTSDENLDALSLIIRGSGTNQAPVLGNTGGAADYTENNPGVIIDGTITVADADSADFAAGILNVSISAGATPGDRLLIFNQGAGAGQIGVSGNDVTYSGVIIGTYSGGLNGGDPLVINLNANADLTATQALLRNITFWNISDTPATAARTVDFVLSDGDGGVSNIVSQTVNVTAMADAPVAVNDNQGLDFDGIDDYVSIADSASLTMTNTVTMEAWIKADSTANVNCMIINKEGEYEVALFSDGTINWAFAGTDPGWTWHNTGYVVPDGEWTHIAVAYDNGKVSTYVNGTLVDVYNGSGPIGDAHATLDELRIGGRSNDPATKYFDGQIDDVRVWSTARTQVQIQTMMDQTLTVGETGLAGYWKFNESNGTTVADSTGNGDNGTLIDGGAGTAGPQWTGYSTDQNTQINITAANGVVSNDIDVDGDSLNVTQVNGSGANVGSLFTLPSGANLTVGALGAFIYNPNGAFDYLDAGQAATDSFTYQVDDGNGGTDTAIVTITINGVEDAPTAAGNTVSTNEDTTYTFIASDFNFSDADGDTLASVKITSLEAVGSLQLSGGDVTLNQVVSKAEIDSGLLKFIPIADENGPSYDSFQFTVNDGAVDSATPNTMTIDVTAINDDPTYAGSLPTDIPAIKETASNVDLSSIDLIDVDAAGGSLNFTLSTSASGTLSATPGGGVTVSGSGSTSMTLIGTLANLNTFLNNAANIQYTGPTDLSGNDVDTIQLDVTDNGNYGSGGGGTITLGTIKVDISNVTISATDASADETGSDAGQFTVDLGALNNTGGDVTVSYTVTGTATATGDYTALTGSIVIADSQQTATIDVSGIVDDALIEGSETVIVTLTGTDNALFTIDAGNNSDTVTIADNDNALNSVSISATDPNAGETATDNGQFTVDLGAVNNTGGDVTVSYTVTGTATATGDYTALSGSIVIADSQQTATIDVSGIVDDALIEGNETVIVTLTGTDNALFTIDAGNNSDTVTIADNDSGLNSVSITATDPNAGETATDNGQFTVDLGAVNNTGADITVSYTVTGTATATGDYTALTGSIVIADSQQTATIDVSGIVDDALIEGSETVIVTLTGTDNALFTIDAGNNSDTVTIADNDSGLNSVSITATDPNAGETATDNGQFTVDLGAVNNTGGDVTVSYTVTGTATATGDYTALTGTVVIADGQQTATIDVSGIVDDALIEGSETVIVTLTGTDNALFTIDAGNNSATVTIADNDTNGTPVAADDAASGNEDNVIVGNVLSNDSDADGDTLTASLVIGPSNGSLTLNADGSFSYTSDADWSGTDSFTYTANDGTLDSNVATVTISVNPVDDTDPDDGGTATDPNPILEDPVADDDEDSDVENPTYETPGEDQLAEDEPLLLVEEYQAPEDSGTAYESIVKMKDPQDEETQEIILLTDEIDSNAQAEERDDDRGYTYYDNDLYKDMSSLKYWNLIDYAAQSEPVVVNLDDISFLDFDGDDSDPVIASDDYDSLRQEIDESFNSELKSQGIKAKIVTVTAATFTVGIVSYLLRAGSLVASMMSALPLWRGFDPIAIFSGDKKKKKKQNEMSDTGELNPEALFDGDAE